MTFISYAQNFEDIVLWRALRDVKDGFYIDVGAADPEEDSVTRAFYEKGWTGINIEPSDEHYARLVEARPRDLNLKTVVGRTAGAATFHVVEGSGLSTLDPAIAERHRQSGWNIRTETIPVLTLTQICDSHPHGVIHFLKVDVEGAEAEVLAGLDLDRIRPWIIVVEATEPNSTTSTRGNWEHLITGRGYDFVYFDGLNCFYLAAEKSDLKERFAAPPNVFDDFLRISELRLRQISAQSAAELKGAREHAQGLEKRLEILQQEIANRDATLAAETEKVRNLGGQVRNLEKHHQHDKLVIRNLESVVQKLRSALAQGHGLEARLQREAAHSSGLQAQLDGVQAELRRQADRADALEYQLRAIYRSDSWRLTRPIRVASKRIRRILLALRGRPADHLLIAEEALLTMVSAAGDTAARLPDGTASPNGTPPSAAADGAIMDRDEASLPPSARPVFRRIAARVRHTA